MARMDCEQQNRIMRRVGSTVRFGRNYPPPELRFVQTSVAPVIMAIWYVPVYSRSNTTNNRYAVPEKLQAAFLCAPARDKKALISLAHVCGNVMKTTPSRCRFLEACRSLLGPADHILECRPVPRRAAQARTAPARSKPAKAFLSALLASAATSSGWHVPDIIANYLVHR